MDASALNVSIGVDVSALSEAMKKAKAGTSALEGLRNKCSEAAGALKVETSAHKEAAEASKEHADAMKALGDIGTKAIGGLAEGMGKIMAGGKKVNPIGDLAKLAGKQLMQFGEKWIAAGIGMTIGLDPMGPLKIAEGTALTAAGAGMQAIKMASGGIVSGSSIVNVGEYAGASHNPEVIAPLDKLQGMMGNNNINVTHKIQGSDLLICLNNEMKNQGYGGTGNGLQQFAND